MALTKVLDSMTSGLATAGHTHIIADVDTLQTTLNNKAALVHTHVRADITDYDFYLNNGPTGTIAETIPREVCPETAIAIAASGGLFLQSVYLMSGMVISNINIWSSGTAAATLTHSVAAIYNGTTRVAVSADITTTPWATNTLRTFVLTSSYTVPTNGIYYIGLVVTATTMPTIKGGPIKTGGQLAAATPILHGTTNDSGLTLPPTTAGTLTGGLNCIYASLT